MDPLEHQLAQLNLLNSRPLSSCIKSGRHHAGVPLPNAGKVAALISSLQDGGAGIVKCQQNAAVCASASFDAVTVDVVGAKLKTYNAGVGAISPKKVGPVVPPKPHKKKQSTPEVPKSRVVKPACEPLYSQRLQSLDGVVARRLKLPGREPILQRKLPIYATQHSLYDKTSKVTLDNPAILEQQLEALAHHKKQLEKKGLLLQQQEQQHHSQPLPDEIQTTLTSSLKHIPKLSSTSLISQEVLRPNDYGSVIYSNLRPLRKQALAGMPTINVENAVYKNVGDGSRNQCDKDIIAGTERSNIYSNLMFRKGEENFDDLPPPPPDVLSLGAVDDANSEYFNNSIDDDVPSPPSPVSSSYSELRRATDVFSKKSFTPKGDESAAKSVRYPASVHCAEDDGIEGKLKTAPPRQTYMNMNYGSDYNSYSPTLHNNGQDSWDYYGYGSCSQSSSTYESIYEPINPRSPSQLSTRSNYQLYAPYLNGSQLKEGTGGGLLSHSSSANISSIGTSGTNTPLYPAANPNSAGADVGSGHCLKYTANNKQQKEAEVEALTDFLVHSLDSGNDVDNYGICFKCNERVLGENSGCTAMDQIYHISCFTCSQCQINLQGKPFYALDGKPFCEYDYLQTLEKCSVCMKPILERILRATGKPYHPQCFTCVVCGNSLDGIPFTVDATNQNYCITDFHKKFAPRCCVCKEPIMPEPGEEETVRVVALDRSFHFECYKCEDCGLLLSSEAEGRGCYPLDDHVLCKSCNAKRVQMLTNRMTTEL